MTKNNTRASNGPSTSPTASPSRSRATPVFSGDVLIVEDNFIIAMDGEELVTELGAAKVHLASQCDEALDVIDQFVVTAAILDFSIEGGTSIRIADALAQKDVPFIFTTGHSDASLFPVRYRAHPMLKKPYSRDDVVALFRTNTSELCHA